MHIKKYDTKKTFFQIFKNECPRKEFFLNRLGTFECFYRGIQRSVNISVFSTNSSTANSLLNFCTPSLFVSHRESNQNYRMEFYSFCTDSAQLTFAAWISYRLPRSETSKHLGDKENLSVSCFLGSDCGLIFSTFLGRQSVVSIFVANFCSKFW